MGTLINTYVDTAQLHQNLVTRPMPRVRPRYLPPARRRPWLGSSTVGSLLRTIQPGSSRSLLLGQCDDGRPFLVELEDPEMGAILVSCDKGCGKTHQLQVMVDSALRLNAPSGLQFGVLTFKPGEWQAWQSEPQRMKYLQGIYAWYDPWAEGFIRTLVDLAEARRDGGRSGADVLLILDDLNFIEELSCEAQVNLRWLLEYGAHSGVWVLAGINSHQAADFRYWVDTFRTRVIGKITSEANTEILALRSNPAAAELAPGRFTVWAEKDWRTYRLPLLGD
jgi:hypothetical protein